MLWPFPIIQDNRNCFSQEEIADAAAPYLHKGNVRAGVYFLLAEDEIIYVGKTVDVRSRLEQHSRDNLKPFNRFFFIPCEIEELDYLEAVYIHLFTPRFNKFIPELVLS